MRQEVHFSDLSGAMLADQEQIAAVTVQQHPELDHAVHLEATPDELQQLGKLSIDAVILDVKLPGEDQEPQRYVMSAANFGKLATGGAMSEVLAKAEPVVEEKPRRGNGSGIDYTSLEHAGSPHKGKVKPEEAEAVRNNLQAVNARLEAAGQRLIDPLDRDHIRRYGFGSVPEVQEPLPAAQEKE